MRILHTVPTYLPAYRYGGPIYSVHGLCKGLVDRGHEVDVFTTNVDGDQDSDVPLGEPIGLDGVQIWYFTCSCARRLYYSPAMLQALQERVRGYDLVHLHSVYLWPTWATARVARSVGVPYLISPRGMLVKDLVRRKSRWKKTFWLKLIEKKNIELASALHVTSQTEADALKDFGFKLPSVFNIANGIDSGLSIRNADVSNGVQAVLDQRPYILYLGRVNWKKGLDRLIRAWQSVNDIRLVIAGNDEEGYTEELEKLAKDYGVEHRLEFVGSVHGEQKRRLYREAQLMVLPSYSENFGIVVLEALAEACPVVVTEEVGAKDIVTASGGGLVTSGEPAHLAAAINKLLADPTRKSRGEKAAQYVRANYSWNSIAGQMEKAYIEILQRAGRA